MIEDSAQSASRHALDDDMALVEASIRGDIAAFEELVRRYDRTLLRIALQVTNNQEDAQEAVQETFLKAYQKLNQFRGNSKLSTWLIRIALNESLMTLRRRRRYTQELPLEYEDPNGKSLPLDVADWSPNPEQLYSRSELQEILRKALEGLPPGPASSLRPSGRRGSLYQGDSSSIEPTSNRGQDAPSSGSAAASGEVEQIFPAMPPINNQTGAATITIR